MEVAVDAASRTVHVAWRGLDGRVERASAKGLPELTLLPLLEAIPGGLPSIEHLIVGRGPGSLMGVRVTCATAQALRIARTELGEAIRMSGFLSSALHVPDACGEYQFVQRVGQEWLSSTWKSTEQRVVQLTAHVELRAEAPPLEVWVDAADEEAFAAQFPQSTAQRCSLDIARAFRAFEPSETIEPLYLRDAVVKR